MFKSHGSTYASCDGTNKTIQCLPVWHLERRISDLIYFNGLKLTRASRLAMLPYWTTILCQCVNLSNRSRLLAYSSWLIHNLWYLWNEWQGCDNDGCIDGYTMRQPSRKFLIVSLYKCKAMWNARPCEMSGKIARYLGFDSAQSWVWICPLLATSQSPRRLAQQFCWKLNVTRTLE